MKLTEKQLMELGRRIVVLKNKLRLSDYDFGIKTTTIKSGYYARVCMASDGSQMFRVELGDPFFKCKREKQDSILVHELLHVHFSVIDDAIDHCAGGISQKSLVRIKAAVGLAEERLVNNLERVIRMRS